MDINQLACDINTWANATFPDRKAQDIFLKSFEEYGELIANPGDPHELADLFILLMDLAVMLGHDIEKSIIEKMEINKGRVWKIDPCTRIMRHTDV